MRTYNSYVILLFNRIDDIMQLFFKKKTGKILILVSLPFKTNLWSSLSYWQGVSPAPSNLVNRAKRSPASRPESKLKLIESYQHKMHLIEIIHIPKYNQVLSQRTWEYHHIWFVSIHMCVTSPKFWLHENVICLVGCCHHKIILSDE